MSFFNDDEFDDDWDDFTPSVQDTLYQNLETLEKNAAAKLKGEQDTEDEDGDFDVFLDELFEIPFKLKENKTKQLPLGEICVNQQHKNASDVTSKEAKVDEQPTFYDSQDDSIWNGVDIESISNLEANHTNIQQTPSLSLNYENKLTLMGGFSTASGKALNPISEKAKQKALKLFNEEELKEEEEKKPAITGFATASGKVLKPVSKEAHKKALEIFEKAEKDINLQVTTDASKVGDGAKTVLSEKEQQTNGARTQGQKRTHSEFKYEKVLDIYGGFQMGNSKKVITPSVNAKKNAILLYEKDSTVPSSPKNPPMVPEMTTMDPDNDTPTHKSTEKKIPLAPSKPNKRLKVAQKQNKPFKSPIIRSNIELTKAAISNKGSSKLKGQPVFDMTPPNCRYKLSSLGKPLSYSKQQLIAKNISHEVINMTINTAKSYKFQGIWGWKQARLDMINSNCASHRLTEGWVQNHYALIVWKIACQIRSYPDQFKEQWQTRSVLNQLLYRYEREVNMGQRPVLRKILEQDDNSVKHMVLVVADIIETRNSSFYNTSTRYRLVLSDGWYQVQSCIDLRMEHAITRKKLKIGHKLSICGAQIIGDKTAQSPLSIKDNDTMLSITSNGCLPVAWDEKLGYHKIRLTIRSIPTIFDDGGTVTAIDVIVCRKLPILYTESLPNGTMVTRTAKEEEDILGRFESVDGFGGLQRQQSYALPNFRANHKSSNTPHLDRTVSEPKNLDERRVSGYFKVRICDTFHRSQQSWATLLLSNANELNHMDIVEGNRYKVFFVQPYHPKNKKYPGLDLKTTRMTRWEPVPLVETQNTYIPRFLTMCADIRNQDRSLDFDLAVYVLQTGLPTMETMNGRKLWHQTLLVTDKSQDVCQVEFRLPLSHFHDITGHVIGLANVRFELYDSKYNITCLKATDETEITTKLSSSAEYLQKGMAELREWAEKHHDRIKLIEDRVQATFH